MLGQPCNEIKDGNGFSHKHVIFMPVVVKGNKLAVIGINARGSNDRSAQITADIFYYFGRLTFCRHGPNIKTVFMVGIDKGFEFFEGVTDTGMKFV